MTHELRLILNELGQGAFQVAASVLSRCHFVSILRGPRYVTVISIQKSLRVAIRHRIDALSLRRYTETVKHVLGGDVRRNSAIQVHDPTRLPLLDDARQDSRTVFKHQLLRADGQIEGPVSPEL